MPDEPIKGYVRAEGLSILATEAVLNKAKPLSGYLDIGTEDGRLRLTMNGCAAADLLVDLKNFLALEQWDDGGAGGGAENGSRINRNARHKA